MQSGRFETGGGRFFFLFFRKKKSDRMRDCANWLNSTLCSEEVKQKRRAKMMDLHFLWKPKDKGLESLSTFLISGPIGINEKLMERLGCCLQRDTREESIVPTICQRVPLENDEQSWG